MHCLLFVNGEYGKISGYQDLIADADLVICADGGANQALALGLVPHFVVGDMDSVAGGVLEELRRRGTLVEVYPREKDDTDTQIALKLALRQQATRITILGGTGDRLDHTLASIYSTLPLVRQGIGVCFYHPRQRMYVIKSSLSLTGRPGDLLSLLALEPASGITLSGLKYPLSNATLLPDYPYTISNEFTGEEARVDLAGGILLVVHIFS